MKIKLNTIELIKAIKLLKKVEDKISSLNTFKNCLLTVLNNNIQLSLYNNDIHTELNINIDAKIFDNDNIKSIAIPFKFLKSNLKNLDKNYKTIIKTDANKFELTNNNFNDCVIIDNLDYYLFDIPETSNIITLDYKEFKNTLKTVYPFIADKEREYYGSINFLQVAGQQNNINFLGIDGYKCVINSIELNNALSSDFNIFLHKKIIDILSSLNVKNNINICFNADNTFIQFLVGNITINADLKYCNYKNNCVDIKPLFNKNKDYKIIDINKKELLNNLKLIKNSCVADANLNNEIFLILENNQLKLTTYKNNDIKLIDVNYNDTKIKKCFNIYFLIDAIENLKNENIKIKINNIMCDQIEIYQNNFKSIILPVRFIEEVD